MFTDIEHFIDFLIDETDIDVFETHVHNDMNKYVTLESLEDASPLVLTEVLIMAYDSGFSFGAFDATRYGGVLTIYE